ncbi:MAG TPA: M23 family metallopeptidase [Terriglobia bacterium]|nr:M23 family metallopeptidase [Terriglobia bacterium]
MPVPDATKLAPVDGSGNSAPPAPSTPPPPALALPSGVPVFNPAIAPQAGVTPPTLKSEVGSSKNAPATQSAGIASVSAVDYAVLSQRDLLIPVVGVNPGDLKDSFDEVRGGTRRHGAIDILAPRGTPVVAVDYGLVKKLFTSIPGGLTIYLFDRQEIYCYYYAHLDHYAEGLAEGKLVNKGEILGFVGTTGDAPVNTPHLHFEITKLGPEKKYWRGVNLNPYPILKHEPPNHP